MHGLLDRFFKQIYQVLEETEMLADSIFIVSADHGESPSSNKRTEKEIGKFF
jgi:arylsulfatase A-like enzyme